MAPSRVVELVKNDIDILNKIEQVRYKKKLQMDRGNGHTTPEAADNFIGYLVFFQVIKI